LTLTRRALGTRLAGFAAAIGFGQSAATGVAAQPASTVDLELRDAALRGLALASHRGNPVAAAALEAALARLAETDPEAALLGRIYQLLDVRPAAYWHRDLPEAAAADLSALHGAIRASQPVAFEYTDLSGQETTRTVLPVALVHPPQGVKLLAWCEERKDFRQFFVRAMQGVTLRVGDFSGGRVALLRGLLEKEAARA
jgi:predicted DNA-binding transcriptional regulator YafY